VRKISKIQLFSQYVIQRGTRFMPLKKKPVTGMKDILPAEMQVRDYVTGLIKETYKSFGFSPIETPCVEHIENLCSKQGGDNEKLIFKILKRGEKLKIDEAKEENDLVDGGQITASDAKVQQGCIEGSNVNVVDEMVKMITISRAYQAGQKVINTVDETLDKTVNQVGKV